VAWRRVRGRPAGKWGLERDCRAPARGRSGSGPGAAVRRVWCRCC